MDGKKYCRLNVSMTEWETAPVHQFTEIQCGYKEDIHHLRN